MNSRSARYLVALAGAAVVLSGTIGLAASSVEHEPFMRQRDHGIAMRHLEETRAEIAKMKAHGIA